MRLGENGNEQALPFGKPLDVTIVIPTSVTTSKQEAELMQNMLQQIGVRLIISVVPSPDFFSKYIIYI